MRIAQEEVKNWRKELVRYLATVQNNFSHRHGGLPRRESVWSEKTHEDACQFV